MNNEFLRPRENRCKWFNILGVMRKWVYIQRSGKCKISHKTTKWIDSLNVWIDPDIKIQARDLWRLIWFIVNLNRFKCAQIEKWCDLDFYESIQCKSEKNHDTTHPNMNWFSSVRFKDLYWLHFVKTRVLARGRTRGLDMFVWHHSVPCSAFLEIHFNREIPKDSLKTWFTSGLRLDDCEVVMKLS